jgi:biofilm PGA synthesis N-glycosyltransferase PgaC
MPKFDGQSMVVLMHDGGGDRSRTLPYLAHFITTARHHGYRFVTVNEMYRPSQLQSPATITTADRAAVYAGSAYLVWPHLLVSKLFLVTIAAAVLTMLMNVILAAVRIRRVEYKRRRAGYAPLISVIVPAYNESAVLAKTVTSLRRSRYRNFEIIIVDDGSTDDTWATAQTLVSYPRVLAYHKTNGGKSSALNFGIRQATGSIIVAVDADTIFQPNTLNKLVRHFVDMSVGAVAGAVKVGNALSPLSRWQALDYTIGIYVERNAQALLGAVMIVPGACGAWRKSALLAAGGFSAMTLAEDFDMTLALHQLGYKIVQDNEAIARTEVPLELSSLVKQRFRWIFGSVQTFWKHRCLLFRRGSGWLGWFAMPLAMFNLAAPLLFGPLLLTVEIENIAVGNLEIILLFLLATMALQVIFAGVALRLAGERWRYLAVAPLTRLLYGPMRSLILYRCLVHVARGSREGWNKLHRTASVVDYRPVRLQTAHVDSRRPANISRRIAN